MTASLIYGHSFAISKGNKDDALRRQMSVAPIVAPPGHLCYPLAGADGMGSPACLCRALPSSMGTWRRISTVVLAPEVPAGFG